MTNSEHEDDAYWLVENYHGSWELWLDPKKLRGSLLAAEQMAKALEDFILITPGEGAVKMAAATALTAWRDPTK